MEPREGSDLDRRLSESLEPDAETVRRLVGRAMVAEARRFSRAGSVLAVAGICIVGWLLYLGLPRESGEAYTLDYVGEVAVIQAPDGTSWVFSEQAQEPGPATESGFILSEGDMP